jgi:hypothetical protein
MYAAMGVIITPGRTTFRLSSICHIGYHATTQ